MGIKGFFTEHPASVGETYGEHFKVAASTSRALFRAAVAAAIHAVVPHFQQTTASGTIRELAERVGPGNRGDRQDV